MQIGDLSRLCSLSLINCIINVDTYTPLTRLTTLRRLNLLHCYGIPACLHQLTTLHSLAVVQTEQYNDQRDDDFARVEQALPHLQQLTFLELDGYPNVPTTLSSLQHLRSLWLTPAWDDEALPTGPWQASLRELGASPNLIALSLPAMATAQQLEVLEVLGAGEDEADLPTIVCWAAQHPSLQRLSCNRHFSNAEVHSAVVEAQRVRPSLQIVFGK